MITREDFYHKVRLHVQLSRSTFGFNLAFQPSTFNFQPPFTLFQFIVKLTSTSQKFALFERGKLAQCARFHDHLDYFEHG